MIQALLGRKLGMTRIFDENGVVTASTLVEAGPCFITQLRTLEQDGYTAVQLGFGAKPRPNRPHKGHLKKAGLPDRQGIEALREVPADSLDDLELGARIDASMFAQGEIVDVIGTSKGKGFAGVMKRHNFRGLRASHGVSISHRSHGSTGHRQDPGRVFKGKKMAGHLGDERITTQNLKVVATDAARGLILVQGSVPGAPGGYVRIEDAVKRPLPKEVPFPAGLKGGAAPAEAEGQANP
jgi:large subunit ribosomal protein L3